ncbi:hypothetical protein BGW80DRAFT_1247760 [Lactifluus volemus]|nr:hypothetical protein BGW80DRAFT_1247760 [Lactifluus volemus]
MRMPPARVGSGGILTPIFKIGGPGLVGKSLRANPECALPPVFIKPLHRFFCMGSSAYLLPMMSDGASRSFHAMSNLEASNIGNTRFRSTTYHIDIAFAEQAPHRTKRRKYGPEGRNGCPEVNTRESCTAAKKRVKARSAPLPGYRAVNQATHCAFRERPPLHLTMVLWAWNLQIGANRRDELGAHLAPAACGRGGGPHRGSVKNDG